MAGLAACGSSGPTPGETQGEIVGGVAAKSDRLDAIGALGRVQPDGSFKYYCTATLVAPRLLLTAKHCVAKAGGRPYTETETIHFGIGADSKAPKRTVKVARTWMAALDEGGFVKRGSDVAVMALDEAIDDVAPLAIVTDHLDASFVDARVSAVGYGIRDIARSSGVRRAGTLTIRSTEGPLVQSSFPSADEMIAFVRAEGGAAYDATADDPRLRELWEKTILDKHELFAGVSPGDAQPCSGDSGGPLVARMQGRLAVVAVVSGSFKLSNRNANPCSVLGEVYATLPSDIQRMIDEASEATEGKKPTRLTPSKVFSGSRAPVPVAADGEDRCAGVSVAGRCDRGAAIRCIAESEGPPRVTRTDCTLLMQTCAAIDEDAGADAVAECVDR
ncbi:MAG: trypsin-like serine protease [Labilithrix sp.]|nr:trypsin-like serine protease [Labilithrix sp.]